jgi:ribosomal protein S18 acetylase RimI-like enzyme
MNGGDCCLITGEIIELRPENLNKCFSFWDFGKDEIKKKRITGEINANIRTMFVYVVNEEYVAGFSIKPINEIQVYLAYLVVREDLRNQGIGSLLIDYTVTYAKKNKIKEISIQVDVDNINAKRLYERKGFVPCQEDNERIRLLKAL